jgi:hypothetical protein
MSRVRTMTSPGFTPAFTSVGAAALAWAQGELAKGVHEIGGDNRGPDVDAYLTNVNLPAGEPWCCAFVVMGIQEGAGALGVPCTCPVTGACLHLWSRAPNSRVLVPQPGDIYVLQHSLTTGHVGFVETITDDGLDVATEISGNTNVTGSREGNAVWRHDGPPEISHGGKLLGYLRF